MAKNAHDGEFSDDTTYTHKRFAALVGRNEGWVLEHILFPKTSDAEGVRHVKIGALYFFTGHDFRLWIERTGGWPSDDS